MPGLEPSPHHRSLVEIAMDTPDTLMGDTLLFLAKAYATGWRWGAKHCQCTEIRAEQLLPVFGIPTTHQNIAAFAEATKYGEAGDSYALDGLRLIIHQS